MGKKKKGAVCNNPIAMARAAGPAPVTGPTIRDYLNRDRPSLEEAAVIIASQYGKKESGALSEYEEQMNDSYRKELKKRREKLLSAAAKKSSSDRRKSKEKKDKKKSKKRKKHRDRSRVTTDNSSAHGDASIHVLCSPLTRDLVHCSAGTQVTTDNSSAHGDASIHVLRSNRLDEISRSPSPTSFTGAEEEKHASRKDIQSQPSIPAEEDHCGLIKSRPKPEPEETKANK